MSAHLRCVGTPISWLALEQHHAGELVSAESQVIEAHLATCGACALCFARIEADARELLPALVVPPPAAPPSAAPPGRRAAPPATGGTLLVLRRLAPAIAGLAIAAAALLMLGPPAADPKNPGELDPASPRTKGGGVGFVLVRDDEGLVAEAGGIYRDGDRWKALVTCPAGMRAAWDLVVFEAGSHRQEAAFPLEPQRELACGNSVPFPGAFRTTGHAPMTVCLVWSDGGMVDRAAVRGASPDTLPHATCKLLDAAP